MEQIRKGYKKTEVGLIPEDWSLPKLGEMIKLKNGYAFSSDFFSNKGAIVITPGNFKLEGGTVFNNKNTLRFNGFYNELMTFKNGDLVIVMTDLTPNCNLLGKAGIIQSNEPILHNQRIGKIIITAKSINKEFLYCYFNSFLFSNRMKSAATGSTVRHTSVPTINSSIIITPTLTEQKAIATALSDVDELISNLEKLIAKKKAIKQGAMQQLLTPPHKGGKRLEGFSGEWVEKTFGEVLKVRHGKDQKEVQKNDGIYPILGTGGLMGYANKFLYDKESVLIGRKGTIDKPKYMDSPFWTVDTLFYSEINDANSAKFIYYNFLMIDWYSYNEASGVPSLNSKTIEGISVALPPTLREQKAIATVLTDIDSEIEGIESKLRKASLLKQGMMQELLTGKTRLV